MSFFKYLKKTVKQNKHKEQTQELSNETDDELIELWIDSKDEGAYMQLTSRYEKTIFGFVNRRLKDKSLSNDIVQECFLTFLKTPENFKNKKDLRFYFITIARNILIKTNKLNETNDVILETKYEELMAMFDQKPTVDEATIWKQHSEMLTEILDEFGEPHRTICDLYYKEGYKSSEIAEKMNIDSKKVRNIIYQREMYIKIRFSEKLGKIYA